jgi:hypothetical protein
MLLNRRHHFRSIRRFPPVLVLAGKPEALEKVHAKRAVLGGLDMIRGTNPHKRDIES